MKSDSRTMQFLYKRTTLIVVSIEGRANVGRYVPNKNVTILGRGTGVFIERAGRVYVGTNDHVLRAHRFYHYCRRFSLNAPLPEAATVAC